MQKKKMEFRPKVRHEMEKDSDKEKIEQRKEETMPMGK